MSSQAPTPEFALAYRDTLLDGFAREVETTKKVFSCIPDSSRDYRPDPNARTAWQLAWHLANTDIQFLDGIADLQFKMENPAEADKPKTSAELVDWYDRNYKRASDRVRALSAEQLLTPIEFFGVFNLPAAFGAKYVKIPSAPARLKPSRLSIIARSPSIQPLPAAAAIIAYSPDTW